MKILIQILIFTLLCLATQAQELSLNLFSPIKSIVTQEVSGVKLTASRPWVELSRPYFDSQSGTWGRKISLSELQIKAINKDGDEPFYGNLFFKELAASIYVDEISVNSEELVAASKQFSPQLNWGTGMTPIEESRIQIRAFINKIFVGILKQPQPYADVVFNNIQTMILSDFSISALSETSIPLGEVKKNKSTSSRKR